MNGKIVDYKTAFGENLVELDKQVNELIEQGFQPFGSPYFVKKTEGAMDEPICQAMVMYLADSTALFHAKAVAELVPES